LQPPKETQTHKTKRYKKIIDVLMAGNHIDPRFLAADVEDYTTFLMNTLFGHDVNVSALFWQ